MKTTYLEKRWGGGGKKPSQDELLEALADLKKDDPEHPDCWVVDEDNLAISAHQNGKVIMENVETDDGPSHMDDQRPEDIIELWRLLQAGDIAAIRAKPWIAGY